MSDLLKYDLLGASEAIKSKEISSVELTNAYDRVLQQLVASKPTNRVHAITDPPHTGKDHAVGFRNRCMIVRNGHFESARVLQSTGNRVQIAHTVIDNGYLLGHKL